LTATREAVDPARDEGRVVRALDPGETSVLLKRRLGLSASRSFQSQLGVPSQLSERRRPLVGALFGRLKGLLVYPDDMRPWRPHAVREGLELLARERFHAILSSSGPPTVNLVARALQERSGLPWVADFRDLWTQKHDYPYGGLRRRWERRLELKTLRSASSLVTVSDPLAQAFSRLHRRPVEVIPNGFDPAERGGGDPVGSRFRIVYTGSLYQGRMDPTPVLHALAELTSSGAMDRELVEVLVFGDDPAWLRQEVSQLGLDGVVSLRGRLPREQVLEQQRAAQLLLLLGWGDPGQRGITTGKVFEYLAAERPILCLGRTRGDVVEALLEETAAGAYCSTGEELQAALLEAYREFVDRGQVAYRGDAEAVARYGHDRMAQRFAQVLDQVAG
jgi:hypothetical protein